MQVLTTTGTYPGSTVDHLHFKNIKFAHTLEDYSQCFNGYCDDQSATFLTTASIHLVGLLRYKLLSECHFITDTNVVKYDFVQYLNLVTLSRRHKYSL